MESAAHAKDTFSGTLAPALCLGIAFVPWCNLHHSSDSAVISVFFLSQTIWPSESVCPLNGIPKCVGAQFAPPPP